MSRDIPNTSSPYAQEGTAAHELAEKCLGAGLDPITFLDVEISGVTVTEDMCDAVRVFTEYCSDGDLFNMNIEQRFDLSALKPPAPMFGTADVIRWLGSTEDGELEVIDYKHGRGYAVDAVGNKQLRYYALGACLAQGIAPETVKMTIVQPRAPHPAGIIRSEVITYDELVGFTNDLMEAARATQADDAPLAAGDHCRFCPAKAQCPEMQSHALVVAKGEFTDVHLPDPRLIPIEQVSDMLSKVGILEEWVRGLRAFALDELGRGNEVPGWKLVAKRATRRFPSEAAVKEWADEEGLSDDELYVKKLKSPAQIEKVVGKKNLPDELVVKASSGNNMAPSDDPRPAVLVGSEFPIVEE